MKHDGLDIVEGSEINNTTVSTGTSDPAASPSTGELFFRTDTTSLRVYTGSAWVSLVNFDIDNTGSPVVPELRFLEAVSNGTNYLGLKAPSSLTSSLTYTLPVAPTGSPSANQYLTVTPAGATSWTSIGESNTAPVNFAASAFGTPTAETGSPRTGGLIGQFVAAVPFTISASGHQGYADTAPSGGSPEGLIFDVRKNGVSIGTITFADGSNVETAESIVETSFVEGDILEVVVILNNSAADVSVTLKGTTPFGLGTGADGPAGADTQVQFNDGGVFGATANLTWDDEKLTVTGGGSPQIAIVTNGDIEVNSALRMFGGANSIALAPPAAVNTSIEYTLPQAPTGSPSGAQFLTTTLTGVLSWAAAGGGGSGTATIDADADTKVDVEESADEDIIRFDTGDSPAGFGAVENIMTLASSGWTVAMGTANVATTSGAPITFTAGTGNTSGAGGAVSLTGGMGGADGAGGAVSITTGAGGSSSGSAGDLDLTGGNATAGNGAGGDINIIGGDSSGTGSAGIITITGGTASSISSAVGDVNITGGTGATSGGGGDVSVTGGPAGAGAGTGGDVIVRAGASGTGAGDGGNIGIYSGASSTTANSDPGNITIKASDASLGSSSNGGDLTIEAGDGDGNNPGGVFTLRSGNAGPTGNYGGDIDIEAGNGGSSSGDGGNINLTCGDSNGSFDFGGAITLAAGESISGYGARLIGYGGTTSVYDNGGGVLLRGGHGKASNDGGTALLYGGTGGAGNSGGVTTVRGGTGGTSNGTGGDLQLYGGSAGATAADGGSVVIVGADASGGNNSGGTVSITAGASAGSNTGANIVLKAGGGSSAGAVVIGTTEGVGSPSGLGPAGELRFLEDDANGTNYLGLNAPSSVASSFTYTLPEAPTGSPNDTQYLTVTPAGIMSWDAPEIGTTPYDITGTAFGTPTAESGSPRSGGEIGQFVAVVPFTISASGHQGYADTAPSGGSPEGLILDVRKNGTSIGTITFADGSQVETAETIAATAFAAGDILDIVVILNNGAADVSVTLKGTAVGGGDGTPAGLDTELQFNDGGAFGASSNLTWDDEKLTVTGTGSPQIAIVANGDVEINSELRFGVGGSPAYTVSLTAPSSVSSNITHTLPTVSSELATTDVAVRKNLIINGNMDIAQRGTVFSAFTGGYTLDRWLFTRSGGGTLNVSQSTDVPNSESFYSVELEVDTSDASIGSSDLYGFQQRIESKDVLPVGFGTSNVKYITFSFWVRSSVTGTFALTFRNGDANRSYVTEQTINSANTWEKKEITIRGDSAGTWLATINGIGLQVGFTLAAGSTFQTTPDQWAAGNFWGTSSQTNFMNSAGTTFDLSRIQLEVGQAATDFEYASYADELTRCQRYYTILPDIGGQGNAFGSIGAGVWTTTSIARIHLQAPVTMRTSPSAAQSGLRVSYGSGSQTVSTLTTTYAASTCLMFDLTTSGSSATAGSGASCFRDNNTSAYMELDAEL